MRTLIFATAAALALGAPLALADTSKSMPTDIHRSTVSANSLADRCTALGTQFDKAEAMHKISKNYKAALSLRSEGEALCSTHKEAYGIKKIESALSKIGVKPMVKG